MHRLASSGRRLVAGQTLGEFHLESMLTVFQRSVFHGEILVAWPLEQRGESGSLCGAFRSVNYVLVKEIEKKLKICNILIAPVLDKAIGKIYRRHFALLRSVAGHLYLSESV